MLAQDLNKERNLEKLANEEEQDGNSTTELVSPHLMACTCHK